MGEKPEHEKKHSPTNNKAVRQDEASEAALETAREAIEAVEGSTQPELTGHAGEIGDNVADATQETPEDSIAQTAEEQAIEEQTAKAPTESNAETSHKP